MTLTALPDRLTDAALSLCRWNARRAQRASTRRAERLAWETARSLPELGALTAGWADGTMTYHPGGYDRGPDPETEPIRADLAALNRGGYVTTGSQPAQWMHHRHPDSTLITGCRAYAQRAGVEGVAPIPLADYLARAARDAGLLARVQTNPPRRRPAFESLIPVSVYTDDPAVADDVAVVDRPDNVAWMVQTMFGGAAGYDIDSMFGTLSEDAAAVVDSCAYLVVVDPQWNRDRLLWDTLRAAVTAYQNGAT